MQTSIFLARLIGPVFLAIGIGMLINREAYRLMAVDFLDSRPLIYLSGLLTLIAGITMVHVHNIWAFDWRLIITIFAWLAVIGGAFRILLPQQVTAIGNVMLEQPGYLFGGGIVTLILGAILSYFGYFA